jgi:hypothetical protein
MLVYQLKGQAYMTSEAIKRCPADSSAGPLPTRFVAARIPLSAGSAKMPQGFDFTPLFDAGRAIFWHRNAIFPCRQGS